MAEDKSVKQKEKRKSVFLKWVLRFVLFFLLLPFIISFFLQFDAVQIWLSQKTTAYLSKELEAKVEVKDFKLSIFDGLKLGDFLVMEDDTLLSAKSLNVSLDESIISLFNNRLKITSVDLQQAHVNLVVEKDGQLNIQRLIEKLIKPSNKPKGRLLDLDIKNVAFSDLHFTLNNIPKSTLLTSRLQEGKIKMNDLDLNKNTFDVEALHLIRPIVQIIKNTNPILQNGQKSKSSNSSAKPLCIQINTLAVLEGIFINNDLTKLPNKEIVFDPNHMDISKIDLDLAQLYYGGLDDISAAINQISLKTKDGFVLEDLRIPHLRLDHQTLSLEKFSVRTKNSNIKRSLVLAFEDIKDLKKFNNRLNLDADFDESTISFEDVAYFIPGFKTSPIYKSSGGQSVKLNGHFYGKIDNLHGENLSLSLGDKLSYLGGFTIKNISVPSEALISLKVDELKTNPSYLKEIIPNFNPPQNFYSLGNLSYSGTFDGFLNDFVSKGTLTSEIGKVSLDMGLNVKNGSAKARYSGDIRLENFDLQKWSGDKNLGLVSLDAKIRDGESLLFKSAKADLTGTLKLLQYKGYDYKNISLNGKMSPIEFDGSIQSADPNINLDFDGKVVFNEKIPSFNFKSNIKKLALSTLNLSKDIISLKGDLVFDGSGNDINNILGKLSGKNISVERRDTTFYFKDISLTSKKIDDNNKSLRLISDSTDIYFEGIYDLTTIANDLATLVKINFPYHTRDWKQPLSDLKNEQKFKFDVEVQKPRPYLQLAGLNDIELGNVKAKGSVNSKLKEITLASSLPYLAIQKNIFYNLQIVMTNRASKGDLLMHLDSSIVSGQKIRAVDMQYLLKGDDVDFSIYADNPMDSIQLVSLKGTISPHPAGYTFAITSNDLRLFNKRWKIDNSSKISLGNKYLDISNLVVTDGTRSIDLQDINNKGVLAKVNRIDISILNPFLKSPKLFIGGDLDANIKVNDIFNKNPSLTGTVHMQSFKLNNDDYGELLVDLAKAENRPLEVLLSLNNKVDGQALKLNGQYDLNTQQVNADVKGRRVSLRWLEYILKDGAKDIKGYADVEGKIFGNVNDLKIDGNGVANEGSVKVIYLGETYKFDKQKFKITEKEIDLTGARISDSQGNIGTVSGRFIHQLFKDFFLDLTVEGDNVIAINTTKYDNPVYYGLGRGQVAVDFQGSVDAPKMFINALTKPGTVINIPIKESRTAGNKNIIKYITKDDFYTNKKDTLTIAKDVKVSGTSIEMNLVITEDAQVNLIFDEAKGDIIHGIGNGNMRISLGDKGEFDMFGTYTITEGEYLFTYSSFVNKPFIVRKGGTIKWTGDPINASINLVADYPVRTTLTNFLAEYLVTDQLKQAAGNNQDVNLKLLLGNTLFNPQIKFDFEFPNLTGELKSYTDSKIRLLKTNEAEYNSQVFGLILWKSFMPSSSINAIFASNNILPSAGISTLSEFVGSQFSIYMTSLINSALEDNGLIAGVDFDLDLVNNSSILGGTGQTTLLPTEIQVRLKNKFRFWDERLTLNVGGNYVRQNPYNKNLNNYLIPEFFIEYALTKDKQLNLKLYGKYDIDNDFAFASRRQRFGLGLRYKSEFGSMRETKTKLSSIFRGSIKKTG